MCAKNDYLFKSNVLVDKPIHSRSNVDHLVNYVVLFWLMKSDLNIHFDHMKVVKRHGMLHMSLLQILQQIPSKEHLIVIKG